MVRAACARILSRYGRPSPEAPPMRYALLPLQGTICAASTLLLQLPNKARRNQPRLAVARHHPPSPTGQLRQVAATVFRVGALEHACGIALPAGQPCPGSSSRLIDAGTQRLCERDRGV